MLRLPFLIDGDLVLTDGLNSKLVFNIDRTTSEQPLTIMNGNRNGAWPLGKDIEKCNKSVIGGCVRG